MAGCGVDLSPLSLLAVAAAAVAAGLVNAVAGGGTLISFPMLTAVGVPAISANVTNTIALSPGYLGGTLAQRDDLRGQRSRLVRLIPAAMLGAIAGSVLLLNTSESVFRRIVPFLILAACGLLAAQDRVRTWVERREAERAGQRQHHESGIGALGVLAVLGAAVYGGYFGAGLGIILLAVLGVVVDDDFTRVNALKQAMSLTINATAAVRFLFSGEVVWSAAAVMAVGSLVGGNLGGRLASRLSPILLRRVVIAVGVVVAIIYLVR
jgi:uncharacterized membrane protein YfcA